MQATVTIKGADQCIVREKFVTTEGATGNVADAVVGIALRIAATAGTRGQTAATAVGVTGPVDRLTVTALPDAA